jgi:hypothetical protein
MAFPGFEAHIQPLLAHINAIAIIDRIRQIAHLDISVLSHLLDGRWAEGSSFFLKAVPRRLPTSPPAAIMWVLTEGQTGAAVTGLMGIVGARYDL